LKKLIYLVNVLFFLGCSNGNDVVKTNLPNVIGSPRSIILNENEAYFFSSHCTGKLLNNCEVWMFQSSIESGYKQWEKVEINLSGNVHQTFDSENEILIALGKNKTDNLYALSKETMAYRLIPFFTGKNIRNVDTKGSSTYIRTPDALYSSVDNGIKWKYLENANRREYYFDKEDSKYVLTETRQARYLSKGNSSNKISITMKSISGVNIGLENDYWVLGREDDKALLRKYTKGEYKDMKVFSKNQYVHLGGFHKYGNFIGILTSGIDQGLLGGFGGTRSRLHVSYDNGETWKEIDLSIDYYVTPKAFYKDKRFVAYSGFGKLTVINFDEYK